MKRNTQDEDYSSDNTVCDVTYSKGDKQLVVSYSYEEYTQLKNKTITAYEFKTSNGTDLYFDHKDVSQKEVKQSYKQVMANKTMYIFNLATPNIFIIFIIIIFFIYFKLIIGFNVVIL